METAPHADLRGIGIITNFDCRLVQPRLAQQLFVFSDLPRHAHQCHRSAISSIDYHVSTMRLPLAMDILSQTSRHVVPLDDGTKQMSLLRVSWSRHERVTSENRLTGALPRFVRNALGKQLKQPRGALKHWPCERVALNGGHRSLAKVEAV
jgi:hypothetical protein